MEPASTAAWVLLCTVGCVLELRYGNRRGGAPTPEAKAIDFVMIVCTAFALVGPMLAALIDGVRASALVVAAGFLIGAAGVLCRLVAMTTLGSRYTLTPQDQGRALGLAVHGPYSRVRHPGYTGIILQLLGMALLLDPLWGVLFVVPVFYFTRIRILGEERMLIAEFGRGYEDYRQAVRWRLIPWIY